jgi:capsule polysaccharide export protein KpsE/RkpR
MPFDATWPPDHAELDGGPFRDQFNGLNDLITDLQNQVSALQNQVNTLQAALATRAPRVDGLAALNIPFHDPPTQDDLQAVGDYSSSIVAALQQP